MTLEEMQERMEGLNTKACEIQALADLEKRDLTPEETVDQAQALEQFDALKLQMEQRQRLEAQTLLLKNPEPATEPEPSNRQTDPELPGRTATEPFQLRTADDNPQRIGRVADRGANDPMFGFRSTGEYGLAVIEGSKQGQTPDARLLRASLSTFGSEGIGADGGFAVPPDFKNIIMQKVEGEDSLLRLTDQLTSSSNNLTVPKDETTPWQTTGGILCNWTAEAAAITQSKPSLETITVKLHKNAVLVPITDELMEDAPALNGWLTKKAPEKIAFKIDLAIVQGTGAGTPLGILNSPHTVSVAKFTSQVADTVVGVNIINMYSRMHSPWRRDGVWLINQDIEPQLMTLMKVGKLDTGAVDTGWGVPLWLPANGLSGSPFSTLFGRPVIPTQACETLGDKGDIIFASLKQYLTVQKTTGIRMDTSIHLWFDQDAVAFRFIMRIAGQPWWNTSIAARDGSTTYSAFVTLDERA